MIKNRLTKSTILNLFFLLVITSCATIDSNDFATLQGNVAREQYKLKELTKRVDILTRSVENSRTPQANLVTDMEYLRQEIARLYGRIEEESIQHHKKIPEEIHELERRLTQVENHLGLNSTINENTYINTPQNLKLTPRSTTTVPITPTLDNDRPTRSNPSTSSQTTIIASTTDINNAESLYNSAKRLYNQKSYQSASNRLEEFLNKYPKDKRIDEVQFMIGESLYAEKKYEEAILAYNQLMKHSPKASITPIAYLKQGMAFAELGDKRTAKIILNKLIKNYPTSTEANQAGKLINKLS